MYIRVTTAQYHPQSDTWTLSGSRVRHNAESAMKLLEQRGYAITSAVSLLRRAQRLAAL